jgi:cytochrome c2
MIFKSLISRFLIFVWLFCGALNLQGQATGDAAAGKTLFTNQCATCHNKNMKDNLTGPALGGVQERWAAFPRTDLYKWIRNSQSLISSGHPRATELWSKWKPTVMSNFNLTDIEIENILAYIEGVNNGTFGPKKPDVTAVVPGATEEKGNNTMLFILLAVILGIFAVVLARILSNLNYMLQLKEGAVLAERKTLVQILTSKGIIAFVIFALVVLGGYTTVNNAISLGRQQGYQPEQPIKFSHVTHAGLNKIDCQYCHDGARRSKQSVIPAANTCMNCHRAIKVGSQYGTAELTKIYASIGYNPRTDKYVENYDKLSQAEVEDIYKRWIADTYVSEKKTLDATGEALIEEQWDGIVSALTDKKEGDYKVQGPIEWVRIHNLPDHAYFNHAQHVAVGKVECQTCHGKIQEMEVVKQQSPLSMGWCINCHRKTEVKFDNDYYKNYYAKYHEQMASGARTKVTVEDVGGLECQKCHY